MLALHCAFRSPSLAATPPGTLIRNQAQTTYLVGGHSFATVSNTDHITVQSPTPPLAGVLSMSVSPATARPGDSFDVLVTIANTGAQALPAGQLVLVWPAGATLSAPAESSAVFLAGTARIPVPGIPVGGSTTVLVRVALPLSIPTGTAEVRAEYSAASLQLSASAEIEVIGRTRSALEGLRYAPASAAVPMMVPLTEYDTGGAFAVFPPPSLPDGGGLVTDAPIRLLSTDSLRVGQILFPQLRDPDQNRDPTVAESISIRAEVRFSDSSPADVQTFRLRETTPDSGVFAGYVQTTGAGAAAFDGLLSVGRGGRIDLLYRDEVDAQDSAVAAILVDPFGRVFDSASGRAIDGVRVTLVDADTGAPARVLGDDGVSTYPSTVVTGSTVTDGGGAVYDVPQGGFCFPVVAPGNYRLDVDLPAGSGFRWPSTVDAALLQALPGAPFAVALGSRGEPFAVEEGPPLLLDLPIDPTGPPLWVRKSASQSDAAAGDFVQYRIEVESTRTLDPVGSVRLTDVLPHGFRYQPGSVRMENSAAPDPAMAGDGRTLEFDLGVLAPEAKVALTYLTQLAAVVPGDAVNRAVAAGSSGAVSNTAQATVRVREDLFRSHTILVGRVAADDSAAPGPSDGGIPGVRIYLEDGTYVVTDDRGMFHFEGIRPGLHVVQLDLDTLPEPFEPLATRARARGTRDGPGRSSSTCRAARCGASISPSHRNRAGRAPSRSAWKRRSATTRRPRSSGWR